MAVRQDTIWERFLKPVVRNFIDEEKLRQLRDSIDWEKESDRWYQSNLTYPEYYRSQNFHGVRGGYLNVDAAVTYDPITQYVLPPNENWVRQELIDAIGGQPRKILDLGCGTGSTTILLKQTFPQAKVMGLDLSPYMLVMANYKAQQIGAEIQWYHGKAEETALPAASFDLVTASLLFHETPPQVSQAILKECFRLLVPGGQVIILDGNQKSLRHTDWLTEIFEEPYIKAYATGSVDAWMGAVGFEAVQTEELWWIHQVTRGIKPTPVNDSCLETLEEMGLFGNPIPAV
jgi:ubiquinone/menaquinone biosynthesis C-methylase UbiE